MKRETYINLYVLNKYKQCKHMYCKFKQYILYHLDKFRYKKYYVQINC